MAKQSYTLIDGAWVPTGGPPGPPGVPSVGYVHHQSVLSTLWVVDHNLGRHPIISTEDATGTLILGTVRHVSDNQLTISFTSGATGRVNCF